MHTIAWRNCLYRNGGGITHENIWVANKPDILCLSDHKDNHQLNGIVSLQKCTRLENWRFTPDIENNRTFNAPIRRTWFEKNSSCTKKSNTTIWNSDPLSCHDMLFCTFQYLDFPVALLRITIIDWYHSGFVCLDLLPNVEYFLFCKAYYNQMLFKKIENIRILTNNRWLYFEFLYIASICFLEILRQTELPVPDGRWKFRGCIENNSSASFAEMDRIIQHKMENPLVFEPIRLK